MAIRVGELDQLEEQRGLRPAGGAGARIQSTSARMPRNSPSATVVNATAGGMFCVGGACVKCAVARCSSRRTLSAPASVSAAVAAKIGMNRFVFMGFT